MGHEGYIRMALEAARNPGLVEPNPQVGAVLVRGGRVIARGRHEYFGGPHAEVNALRKAGRRAQGATLYVSLEPCCTFGKTPPCTDAIIAAKVAHVVIGAPDPTQKRGVRMLRRAGIRVTTGVLKEEAVRLIAPFYKLSLQRRPYVIAKWAMSLDGKIATRSGDSRWISCAESRRRVHEVRSVMDGIVVGIGTVLADDPMLTARLGEFKTNGVCPYFSKKHWLQATSGTQRKSLLARALAAGKPPYHRIVLDSRARTPLGSRLVKTAREVKTLIAVTPEAPPRRCRRLAESGCEVVCCRSEGGRVDIEDLLGMLGRRRLTNLLVEGGSAVLGAFFDAGAVDQAMVFIAPRLIGGSGAVGAMGGAGAEKVIDSLKMMDMKVGRSGEDVVIEGYTREAMEYLRV